MKTIITATIVIVILVALLGATLMIGAPAVYANQADTEQEAGIASDAGGGCLALVRIMINVGLK